MPSFSRTALRVPGSGIRRIHEIALRMPDVIGLAVGEPDQPVGPHVLAAASAAWLADDTDYTANAGIRPLREAIAARSRALHGTRITAEQVWVTPGGTEALYLALALVLDPGDEVLVPDPGYPAFTTSPRMLSAIPVPYRLDPAAGFEIDAAGLERLVTPRTRAIVVNSPSNPLGVVQPEPVLRAVLDVARRHDLWVISDEVYEAFAYGRPHGSLAALDRDDRVLTVSSLSKTYALTGARVGWLVVPADPDLELTLRTYQEAIVSCVNTPAQHAGVAALTGPQDSVEQAREHYRGNLDAASRLLTERGLPHLVPQGAFYLWIDVSAVSGGDVASWAERFLREQRVSVAPGSAFGAAGEGWIRVCAAASRADLLAGLERLPLGAGSPALPAVIGA
ncbi:aminotransferase class I/II-fold pyridoxal phosphate-dependent enzyme [Amnibacterium sp. CER49]|uniref:pyridoxal phosphate-dependent aminotransferase n=1 Tax=Amnibacterium sp. CER49 TaxID=3039161 RepID=UPI00244B4C8D|nr:aminotransferase class I/II-fold pyridoxal phosphate-dependent enzyme [Amnibacterium sp. CER49]MDH2442456.1 aminotransferase class I/II-fold pyridoxal phosphate-dependent enzyme [Amnibacterium sp. CER49]